MASAWQELMKLKTKEFADKSATASVINYQGRHLSGLCACMRYTGHHILECSQEIAEQLVANQPAAFWTFFGFIEINVNSKAMASFYDE